MLDKSEGMERTWLRIKTSMFPVNDSEEEASERREGKALAMVKMHRRGGFDTG